MNRKILSLVVLGVVLPLGLLAAFRTAGILGEPPALETVTKEAVCWQIDRPSNDVDLIERVENTYTNDEVSLGIGVHIAEYEENELGYIYEGGDGVELHVYVNATMNPAFAVSFAVKFYPIDYDASVWVREDFQVKHNVTVTHMKGIGTNASEAYVSATVTDSPSHLRVITYWLFNDQNIKDHQLKVVLEFTYRNTSTYKKLVLPILLDMVRDVGNTFETAKYVKTGEYRGCLESVDYIDMYAVEIQEGQTLSVVMTPPEEADYDLYLYNQDEVEIDNSTQTGTTPESIIYHANSTETLYIKVKLMYRPPHVGDGIYRLKVKMLTP